MTLEESTEAQLEKTCQVLVRSDLLDMAVRLAELLESLQESVASFYAIESWVQELASQLGETSSPRGS